MGRHGPKKGSYLSTKALDLTAARKGASGAVNLWDGEHADRLDSVGSIYSRDKDLSKKGSYLSTASLGALPGPSIRTVYLPG